MTTTLLFIAIAAGGFLLGGLNGAIIASRLVYKDDIREHGSGNAGLTNFYRTYGSRAIFLVLLIDILKAGIPVILGGMLLAEHAAFSTMDERLVLGRLVGGLFAMLGHVYPWLYGFRGGKGALTTVAAFLFIDWRVALICFAIFALVVLLSRYVSLGSVIAGIALPIVFSFRPDAGFVSIILVSLYAVFVVYRHRENLIRLTRGEERKLSFKRKPKSEDEENTEGDT